MRRFESFYPNQLKFEFNTLTPSSMVQIQLPKPNFISLYNLGSIPKLSFAEYDESVLALLSSVKPSWVQHLRFSCLYKKHRPDTVLTDWHRINYAQVMKSAYMKDSKSFALVACGFKSHLGHLLIIMEESSLRGAPISFIFFIFYMYIIILIWWEIILIISYDDDMIFKLSMLPAFT